MGFLFPHAPKPAPPPNPATAPPSTNSFATPTPYAGAFIGGQAYQRKQQMAKTSLIGGGGG